MRKAILAALACLLLSVNASAQTVTVDATATPNGTTLFTSVWDAMNSFDAATTGPNTGQVGDNIIEITNFGPYDETWGNIGNGGTFAGLYDGGDKFIVRGTSASNRPLVLLRDSGISGSGFNVDGQVIDFENIIFATSDAGANPVSDDFGFFVGDGTVVTWTNVVLTSLPPSATVAYSTYTQETDIPSDLLDGSRPYAGSGATSPEVVDTGDNGFFTGLFNGTDAPIFNLVDCVITQQGQDTFVSYANSAVNISGASVISAGENFHFQTGNNAALTINGVDGVPVEIATASSFAIRTFNYDTLDLQHVWIHDNAGGIFLADDGTKTLQVLDNLTVCNNDTWGFQVFSDAIEIGTISNSIFWGNGAGGSEFTDGATTRWDGGNIESLADTGNFDLNSVTLGNPLTDGVTVVAPANLRLGREAGPDTAAATVTITDSIIAGPGLGIEAVTQGGGSTTVTNSALVTAGPYALSTTFNGTVATAGVINDNPAFISTTCGDASFLDVGNNAYAGQATGGADLGGGATFVGGTSVDRWMLYSY